jgi:hypothetical protein
MLDYILEVPYIIRRGHFVLIKDKMCRGRFYTVDGLPKQLSWEDAINKKVILLVRDPRDICVSGAWLWQQSEKEFLDRMIQGDVARCGRWDEYNHQHAALNCVTVRYEDLLSNPFLELSRLASYIGVGHRRIEGAIEYNSFANYKSQVGNDEDKLRESGLRKGIAGDWKNYFTPEMNDRTWSEFGQVMKRLGYKK